MNTANYPYYCAGEFRTSSTPLDVTNPFNGETIATTFLAEEKDIEDAIKGGTQAISKLKELAAFERSEILKEIASKLENNKNHLAEILCLESAKPIRYARIEVERAIQTFQFAAEETKRFPSEIVQLDWTERGKNKEGFVKYFPIGIVAGISPFNFPLNLAVHKIAPAIASACPIVLKPASSTPLSTLELASIINETNLPKGALSILPLNRTLGNKLVTDQRFNLLSFTGSPEVGWEMKKNSGKKKVVLELGGNAASIVHDCEDWDNMLNQLIIGAFSYSGQICIHTQRIYVREELFEKFLYDFVEKAGRLIYGNPLDDKTEISNMIDCANAVRVEKWIAEAIEMGAKLIIGGKRNGSYMEPSILSSTNKAMKVNGEEAFGPLVCIEPYKTLEEAINLVNESKFGLQCSIYTNQVSVLDKCFAELEVGGLIHNNASTVRYDQMPYGGIKESGLGREGVKYAMLDMLEPRLLVK